MTPKSLYQHFGSHLESRWRMEPQNAKILYDFVKEHPIKKVLELGTGIGTSCAFIALALKDKGETDYHIDTVEQFDKCIKLANELIPPELKENVTIHKANMAVWGTDSIPYQYFSIYDKLPEDDYDLIVNDGPSPIMEGEHYIELPNGTITKMLQENKIKPGAYVLWDGRIQMLRILERYYGDNFWLVRPAQKGDDCNILQRKDNPIQLHDWRLANMVEQGYFSGLSNEKNTNTSNS